VNNDDMLMVLAIIRHRMCEAKERCEQAKAALETAKNELREAGRARTIVEQELAELKDAMNQCTRKA
jgi:hypothetical protein